MQSSDFVALLHELAPLDLAETWDNVGVLVSRGERAIKRVLLTIDLTSTVLREALEADVDAIISYHPPIFTGMKRIVQSDSKGNLLGQLLHAGIIVYSPHTALDAVVGGVNDWLTEAFPIGSSRAIVQSVGATDPRQGQGRIVELSEELALSTCITRIKLHLNLAHVRVSRSSQHEHGLIRSVAVCAGAGGSLLSRVRADLLLTGEMRHHDVVEQREQGVSVVLTDHTNTERGYLPVLRRRLSERAPDLTILVSNSDADPLAIA